MSFPDCILNQKHDTGSELPSLAVAGDYLCFSCEFDHELASRCGMPVADPSGWSAEKGERSTQPWCREVDLGHSVAILTDCCKLHVHVFKV